MTMYLIMYLIPVSFTKQTQYVMLIQHGHVNPKDRTIFFFSCGDVGYAVVISMEYHLRQLDSVIIFLEYFMMFDCLDFPDLNLVANITKSRETLMNGVLKGKKAF